ncbi:MAG: glycosyltransferase family 4 protein [Thermodesulfovibrionales bacterium]|nr:glycosyltransferase family 4 protein [Thermodesulfovibrionales bacterium]
MPKPNIIVASMPPHDLAYEAVMLAKKNNIPILVDIRDPWPDIFLDHVPTRLKNFVKILLYKDFRMIKKTMQMADGLIAATNAFLQWGLRYTQRQRTWKDRVFYLGYKKNKGLNNPEVPEKFSNLIEDLENKFNIFFVGTISRSYHNPFVLLEAAEELSEHDNIHFIIAGDGELFEELKKKTENYSNVTLTGWINQQEIELWLEYSKIGVCPATKNVALPTNKAFAYISAGLPVISAFQGDLKDIIEKYQIGLYYPPNDVDALVSCIKRLYEDKDLYAKMSSNAKRVFDEMFDADKIYEEYADHIEKVINEYRSGEGYGFD